MTAAVTVNGKKIGRPITAPCGTKAAYARHLRNGENPQDCELCATVRNTKPKRMGRPPSRPCGTMAAWARHKRRGEQPCQACVAANREYTRQLYLKNRGTQGYVRPYRRLTMPGTQPLTWGHLAAMIRAREDLTIRLGLSPEICAVLTHHARQNGLI